jgi:hypothetical protein
MPINIDNIAGCCPTEKSWNQRKTQFRQLESSALGEGRYGDYEHEQQEPLILEMEHAYCAGAWIATILLAHAIVEINFAFHGFDDCEKRASFLAKFKLEKNANQLRLLRNSL